jgi:hypothetical protein
MLRCLQTNDVLFWSSKLLHAIDERVSNRYNLIISVRCEFPICREFVYDSGKCLRENNE